MQQLLTVIATIAGLILVCWVLIVNPVQDSGKPEDSSNQLIGIVIFLAVIAALVAGAILIAPYIAIVLLWLLGILVAAVLLFLLVKILRPLLPRVWRALRKLVEFLRRHSPSIVRTLAGTVRRGFRWLLWWTMRVVRWIAHPPRWRRFFTHLASMTRRGALRAISLSRTAMRATIRIIGNARPRRRRSSEHSPGFSERDVRS